MVVIAQAFRPRLVGGLDSRLGTLIIGALIVPAECCSIHYVNPLLSDVVAVPGSAGHADRAPVGAARHPEELEPRMSVPPRPSATSDDLRSRPSFCSTTRAQRWRAGFLVVALRCRCSTRLPARPRNQFCPGGHRLGALMLFTAWPAISLGHAGLLAAGAFTTASSSANPRAVLGDAAGRRLVGALIGLIFVRLPSLRLRVPYLAVSTLALHFVVIYLGNEYEARRGYSNRRRHRSTQPAGMARTSPRAVTTSCRLRAAALLLAFNPLRQRRPAGTGCGHPGGRRLRSASASTAGLQGLAFTISSKMTAVCGGPLLVLPGFVSAEAFSLFLTIQYVAMCDHRRMARCWGRCSAPCSSRLFPYLIEWLMAVLPTPSAW